LLLSPLIGKIVDYAGPRRPAIAAFMIGIPTFVVMSFAVHNTIFDMAMLGGALVFFGLFVSVGVPAMMVEIAIMIEELQKREPERFGSSAAFSLGFGKLLAAVKSFFVDLTDAV
jgi:MFS-type transporter involved in bile tolerance (Atg22 family)